MGGEGGEGAESAAIRVVAACSADGSPVSEDLLLRAARFVEFRRFEEEIADEAEDGALDAAAP